MKKIVLLISVMVLISTVFAFNPMDFVPADVDMAFEISLPDEIAVMLGEDVEDMMGDAAGLLNQEVAISDLRALVFGKFGLNDLLFNTLAFDSFYDISEMLDSEEGLITLASLPFGLITNAINLSVVMDFIEGDFMQEALEAGVDFTIQKEAIEAYDVKHVKIRFYEEDESIFVDLYFVEFDGNYFFMTSDYDLLKTSLMASKEETMRLSHYSQSMSDDNDYFMKFQNNGLNLSMILLRMMDITDGEPDSEFVGVGIDKDEIYVDFVIDMNYVNEVFQKNTIKYKTDDEFFNAMPTFEYGEEITNFISLPQTKFSLSNFADLLYEIPLFNSGYNSEMDYIKFVSAFGPEIKRINICYSDNIYSPYMLLKCRDTESIFNNFVKANDIETATVGYIEYSYDDDVYIGYDKRYEYIEIANFDTANFDLRQGELQFTEKLKSDALMAEYIPELPENLWGTINYGDLFNLTVEFDEEGNLEGRLSFSLSAIEEMQIQAAAAEKLSDIVYAYTQIMSYITDKIYYYPEEAIEISKIFEDYDYMYYIDEEMLKQFKISAGYVGDQTVYNVYYGGMLPEGTYPETLKNLIEENLYYDNVEVSVKGEIVLMRIKAE